MDNRELFTDKSEDYVRFRPSYPAESVAWMRAICEDVTVADVGAGTGIFTACLKPYFSNILAVEPNKDMRQKFVQLLPDIPCFDSCGEATGLQESSVGLITVAQAFHWLDEAKFKQEALRILQPGGLVAIIWNNSLQSDFSVARDEVCRKYCPRFSCGHAGKRSVQDGDIFLRECFFKKVEVAVFPNPFTMDLHTFEGNMRSRSYALTPGDKNYDVFSEELRAVFEKHAISGMVTDFQHTTVYLGYLA